MKNKSALLIFSLVFTLVSTFLVLGYEKAELVNDDMVVVTRASDSSKLFAINLGQTSFKSGSPMNIELLINVPCDKQVVTANADIKDKTGKVIKSWKFSNAVPASCFAWYVKLYTTAPSSAGTYLFSYTALDSRTGGVAVTESKIFDVTAFGGSLSCPVDQCTAWGSISEIPNGRIMERECTDYTKDPVSSICSTKVTTQNQLVCDAGYYINRNQCIPDSADSDNDGTEDSQDSDPASSDEPIIDLLESIGVIDPGTENQPMQDRVKFSGLLIPALLVAAIYFWGKR